jgi:shikimate dehydrogenase
MKRFAVIGQPIAHSLSPRIHQAFAHQCGIALQYIKEEVATDEVEAWVKRFFEGGGAGLNVTLPLKEAVFRMADKCEARAAQAQSANTLWMDAGALHADNTDGIGLVTDLSRYLSVKEAHILILGAGGAVRGILAPLLEEGPASIVLSNRSIARAQVLQADFPALQLCDWGNLSGSYDLVINGTSAGLAKQALPLKTSALSGAPFAYDLSYSKEGSTPFLQQAFAMGWQGVDGLGMLVEQAAQSFYIWNGVRPDSEALIQALRSS